MNTVFRHELSINGDEEEVFDFISDFDITKWAPQPDNNYSVKTAQHPIYGGEILFVSENLDTVLDNLMETANRYPNLELMLSWFHDGNFAHGFAGNDTVGYFETSHISLNSCDCNDYLTE